MACVDPANGWLMPGGVVGRLRSRGWRDGDERGEESKTEEVDGEPPGDDEGDIYARSSGLMKAIVASRWIDAYATGSIYMEIKNIKFNGLPTSRDRDRANHLTLPFCDWY